MHRSCGTTCTAPPCRPSEHDRKCTSPRWATTSSRPPRCASSWRRRAGSSGCAGNGSSWTARGCARCSTTGSAYGARSRPAGCRSSKACGCLQARRRRRTTTPHSRRARAGRASRPALGSRARSRGCAGRPASRRPTRARTFAARCGPIRRSACRGSPSPRRCGSASAWPTTWGSARPSRCSGSCSCTSGAREAVRRRISSWRRRRSSPTGRPRSSASRHR